MKSMTGFGRGLSHSHGMSLETTIRALNHRHCMIKVKIPPELFELENFIRNTVSQSISRGSVEIYMKLEYPLSEFSRLKLDHVLAREYVYHLQKLSSTIDIPRVTVDNSIRLDSLLNIEAIWSLEAPDFPVEDLKSLIGNSLTEAIQGVQDMREAEGQKLNQIIKNLFSEINQITQEIEDLMQQHQETVVNRLKKKIQERFFEAPVNQMRLEEEVLYYCEKSDITEEIDRLKTHLQAALEACNDNDPVGRKLEFLIQEMHREANTLGVKAASAEISSRVVTLKTLLDKLKEHIHNIE